MARKQCSWCITLVVKVNKVYGIDGPIYLCANCTQAVIKQTYKNKRVK